MTSYLSHPLATSTDTVITLMPRNLTVKEGEYATFRCELPCSHVAFWYVGDFHNSFPLPYDDTDTELVYTRGQIPEDGCSATDPGTYIDTITLLATSDMNKVAVQCSASMIQCGIGDTCNSVYSRFRTLRGMDVVCVCVRTFSSDTCGLASSMSILIM